MKKRWKLGMLHFERFSKLQPLCFLMFCFFFFYIVFSNVFKGFLMLLKGLCYLCLEKFDFLKCLRFLINVFEVFFGVILMYP